MPAWLLPVLLQSLIGVGAPMAYNYVSGKSDKRRYAHEKDMRKQEQQAQEELLRYLTQSNMAQDRQGARERAKDRSTVQRQGALSRLNADQNAGLDRLAAIMMRQSPEVAASHQMEYAANQKQRAMRDLGRLAVMGDPQISQDDMVENIYRYAMGANQ